MKTNFLAVVAAVVGLSGCVIVTQPSSPGDVTMTWVFPGNGACADFPQVKNMVISIPGQALENAGVYPCLVAGYPGIVLTNFAGGNYTYTVEARGYSNETIFSGSGSFHVNGPTSVTVNLTGNGNTGTAYLQWVFPPNSNIPNPTCAEAGVTSVNVSIDGAQPYAQPCADGQSASGAATAFLSIGTHTLTLSAVDSTNFEYYRYTGNLTITSTPAIQTFSLQWAVGTVELGWTFSSGGVSRTCQSAGVSEVLLNFQDSTGQNFYSDWAHQPCSAGVNGAAVDYYLPPGTWRIFMTTLGTGGTYSSASPPPTFTVQTAVFPNQPLVLTLSN